MKKIVPSGKDTQSINSLKLMVTIIGYLVGIVAGIVEFGFSVDSILYIFLYGIIGGVVGMVLTSGYSSNIWH